MDCVLSIKTRRSLLEVALLEVHRHDMLIRTNSFYEFYIEPCAMWQAQ
jgi:hypothetical protein